MSEVEDINKTRATELEKNIQDTDLLYNVLIIGSNNPNKYYSEEGEMAEGITFFKVTKEELDILSKFAMNQNYSIVVTRNGATL